MVVSSGPLLMAGGENICGKNECSFWHLYALWLCLTIVNDNCDWK